MTDLETVWKTTHPTTFGKYENGLKLGGCKITADGTPQGKTAWFTTPYLTGGPAGEKDWKGEPGLPVDAMKATMKTCYDNNLQVLIPRQWRCRDRFPDRGAQGRGRRPTPRRTAAPSASIASSSGPTS